MRITCYVSMKEKEDNKIFVRKQKVKSSKIRRCVNRFIQEHLSKFFFFKT